VGVFRNRRLQKTSLVQWQAFQNSRACRRKAFLVAADYFLHVKFAFFKLYGHQRYFKIKKIMSRSIWVDSPAMVGMNPQRRRALDRWKLYVLHRRQRNEPYCYALTARRRKCIARVLYILRGRRQLKQSAAAIHLYSQRTLRIILVKIANRSAFRRRSRLRSMHFYRLHRLLHSFVKWYHIRSRPFQRRSLENRADYADKHITLKAFRYLVLVVSLRRKWKVNLKAIWWRRNRTQLRLCMAHLIVNAVRNQRCRLIARMLRTAYGWNRWKARINVQRRIKLAGRRASLRSLVVAQTKAFSLWVKRTIKAAELRRRYRVFRMMHSSEIRRRLYIHRLLGLVLRGWKLQFVPLQRRIKNSLRRALLLLTRDRLRRAFFVWNAFCEDIRAVCETKRWWLHRLMRRLLRRQNRGRHWQVRLSNRIEWLQAASASGRRRSLSAAGHFRIFVSTALHGNTQRPFRSRQNDFSRLCFLRRIFFCWQHLTKTIRNLNWTLNENRLRFLAEMIHSVNFALRRRNRVLCTAFDRWNADHNHYKKLCSCVHLGTLLKHSLAAWVRAYRLVNQKRLQSTAVRDKVRALQAAVGNSELLQTSPDVDSAILRYPVEVDLSIRARQLHMLNKAALLYGTDGTPADARSTIIPRADSSEEARVRPLWGNKIVENRQEALGRSYAGIYSKKQAVKANRAQTTR
jgi:hypothetical protein